MLYHEFAPSFLPEMIMNISMKFLRHDEVLRSDIKTMLEITSSVIDNQQIIDFFVEEREPN